MIIYFTGTGNSRYLAMALSSLLEDECVDSKDYLKKEIPGDFTSEKPYIFVFPTYAWKMPYVFEKFIRDSKFEGNKQTYFVMNYGGDNGNAEFYTKKLCEDKGFKNMGLAHLKMPDNYVALYPVTQEEEISKKIAEANTFVYDIVEMIKNQKEVPSKKINIFDKLKSGKINSLFFKLFVKTKKFYVTNECISCGICVNGCALNNISLKDGKPVWGDKCTHCMACISACPKNVIGYGNATKNRKPYYLSKERAKKFVEELK